MRFFTKHFVLLKAFSKKHHVDIMSKNKEKLIILTFLLSSVFAFSQKPEYTIGILADDITIELNPLLEQLKTQIKAVVGEDAKVSFPPESIMVNKYNFQVAQEQYRKLLDNQTDIILAFGVVNNQVISKQANYPKPTILFGSINKDFSTLDLTKEASGIENFTYLIQSKSFVEDFNTFYELTEFKTLGIVLEAFLLELLPIKETFDKIFNELGADYQLIPFNTMDDIINDLEGIQAIYLAGDFYLSENETQELVGVFNEKQIPSFTSLGVQQVEMGIMATNQSRESVDQFFRRISLTIEGFINGTPLSEMPVFIEYHPRLTINYNTAQKVNVPIKYSLIQNTDFVGELKNQLSDKAYSLYEIIQMALDQNLSLKSQVKEVELSHQEVKLAKSRYLPNISLSGRGLYVDPKFAEISNGQNPEFSTSGNIILEQVLFSEAAKTNIAIQKRLQKAQQENYNTAELDVIFNVMSTYFNVLISKTVVQIQSFNLDLTRQNLRIAEQNFEAGQSGKSDLLRFRSQLAQNTQSLMEAINGLEQSFVQLNQITNNPVENQIDIEDVSLDQGIFEQYNYSQLVDILDNPNAREPFIAFLIQEAIKNAPELKSIDYNMQALERNLRLHATGRFYPTLALQGQFNKTFDRSGSGSRAPQGFSLIDQHYNVGVNIAIPIFNQNQNNLNRQISSIQIDQLNINSENTRLSISSNIRTSVLDLINQLSNIQLSEVSEQTAREALELTQVAYSNGAVNIIQLIDAQNNYLSAQLARNNAAYRFLLGALQVERFLGYYFLLQTQEDNNRFNRGFLEFLNTLN